MSIIRIDIDDDALNEAMQLMGTTIKRDAVNAALRDYAVHVKRLQAVDERAERAERSGVVEGGA